MARKRKDSEPAAYKALERLVVEYVPVDSIKPNPYNPNRQSEAEFKMLCRNITEDGMTQPIVVNTHPDAPDQIVDGEHRWRGCKHLGWREVPIVRVNMNPAQMRLSTLRHNRARGSEVMELSAEVLRDLEKLGAVDWVTGALDMPKAELDKILEAGSAADMLAGAEFSEAWIPGREDAAGTMDRGQKTQSVSAGAAESQRLSAKEASNARLSSDKRRDAMLAHQTFTLTVTLSKAENALVRRVLGENPAGGLLKACRYIIDNDLNETIKAMADVVVTDEPEADAANEADTEPKRRKPLKP